MERPRARRHRARLRLVAVLSSVAAACSGIAPSGLATDEASLLALLGAEARGAVEADGVRWEPSGGILADALLGRRILFLARNGERGERDLFRARVRVTPEGHVVGVRSVVNLSGTSLADEHTLLVRGTEAAYLTRAFGQEQSATWLDLSGAEAAEGDALDRAMLAVTAFQTTGAFGGIARSDVLFDAPAERVGVALRDGALELELERGGVRDRVRIDPRLRDASPSLAGKFVRVEAQARAAKAPVQWAVDTVRAIPWVGPAPIAWLEERVFALRDRVKRVRFGRDDSPSDVLAAPQADEASVASPPPSGGAARRRHDDVPGALAATGPEETTFPPPNLPSIWKTPEPGEGEWSAPNIPWLRRVGGGVGGEPTEAPPPFVRTFVRPDDARPYVRVVLVAMDMRQLELAMQAGAEDPKPLTGAPGPGRIPRDPKVFTRVAAAFNGAFKTEHGSYGMMVDRRVLLPPQPSSATVVVLSDARVGLGTWGPSSDDANLTGLGQAEIVSLRQNLDPLLELGVLNPAKRSLWGFTLPGTGMQTERSGLCVTGDGHLIYAWGDDLSATTLAKAMRTAGCTYGMHLDMNPKNTGFVFTAIDDIKARRYRTELASSDMGIRPERYVEHAQKDFFYLLVHDPAPPQRDGLVWAPSPGRQPPPRWIPALYRASVSVGDRLRGGEGRSDVIELVDVRANRVAFRGRAGASEPSDSGAAHREGVEHVDRVDTPALAPEDRHVLLTLGCGAAHDKRPLGLRIGATRVRADGAHVGHAWLVLPSDAAPRIADAADAEDAIELPLVLDAGAAVATAALRSERRPRSALGVTADGHVVVARGEADSFLPLAEALAQAGALRAVALDRGSLARGAIARAGDVSSPERVLDRGETRIEVVAQPMKPRAYRFEASPATPSEPRNVRSARLGRAP
jgi:hypothetical protein